MANIIQDLMKKVEAGYILVDNSGKYHKEETIKKDAFKAYNKSVASGEINPLEYDFKRYFEWFLDENFVPTSLLISTIEDILYPAEEEFTDSVEMLTDSDTENEEGEIYES